MFGIKIIQRFEHYRIVELNIIIKLNIIFEMMTQENETGAVPEVFSLKRKLSGQENIFDKLIGQ